MADEIAIVTSADDRFSVGLAGTMKSMMHCLSQDRTLRLYVLDGGITDENKQAIEQHLKDPRLAIEWLTIDRQTVSSFVVSDHVSDATYYRLLAPEILPASLKKFIYLDSDMLILKDIACMWDEPMNGLPCLAIQDAGAPYVDCEIALATRDSARQHVANQRPIPNYKELGLEPSNPYFNGGVLVVDLDMWRREQLARQMLQVLHDHREHVTYWDQYALNVVLSGRWKPLDPRWNQNSYILRLPGWRETIFSKHEYLRYTVDPWIVHFNWIKPWQPECTHPYAAQFLTYLKGSKWEQSAPISIPIARPEQPKRSGIRAAAELVRNSTRPFRRSVSALFNRRRAA